MLIKFKQKSGEKMINHPVQEQYNQLAKIYDSRWKSYLENTLTFLKDWAEISPEETLLDVACGTGEFESLILNQSPSQSIVGIDFSEEMLDIARYKCQAFPDVSFQVSSAETLPFAESSFDVIVCASAFHYFEHPSTALEEMRRVLKNDGRVIILDWCKDYLSCQILDFFLKIFDSAHERCYTQLEFHDFLKQANFKIIRSAKKQFGLWGLMIATCYKN